MPAPLAVFTRNHREHIKEALKIAHQDPDRPITFRSMQRWARPNTEIDRGRQPVVYIAVVEEGDSVRYRALLRDIILDPMAGQQPVESMLENTTESTKGEGLWPGTRTLYSISNLEEIDPPFKQITLKKFSDGKAIDAAYTRAYCLVEEKP